MRPLRFTRSSRKHRIGKASARYVIATYDPVTSASAATGIVQHIWVGADERDRELEIVAFAA